MRRLWWPGEEKFLLSLDTPYKIQSWLDALPYNPDNETFSPRYAMLAGNAHCLEGALIAAAALELQGHPPLVVNFQAHRDDHHMVTVYKTRTGWGSIGKSNTTTLRGRQPYYKSVHELVMSYFDFYFNLKRQPALYAYRGPIHLDSLGKDWRTSEENLEGMGIEIGQMDHYELISLKELERLPKVSEQVASGCFFGADKRGLHRP